MVKVRVEVGVSVEKCGASGAYLVEGGDKEEGGEGGGGGMVVGEWPRDK